LELPGPWSDVAADPDGPNEILCHNDLAPWNLVARSDGDWAFIDWDLAAPGRRAWDLAWAILAFAPLTEDAPAARRRIAVFLTAYGWSGDEATVLDVATQRADREAAQIRERGGRNGQPWARLLAEGHAEVWAAAAGRASRT
jgi:aminoglycoside phosphotransferase (APT) family kinase protein